MEKNNIIIFTGIDSYSLEEALSRWVRVFGEKYGEHNISRIDASDTNLDWRSLEGEVVSGGFLAEKRLFIVRNLIVKIRKKEISLENSDEKSEEEEDIQIKEISIMKILDTIPDDNFIIFVNPEIPKTKKLYKTLDGIGTKKTFPNPYSQESWLRRFNELPEKIIQEVVDIYKNRDNPKEPRGYSYEIYTTLEHVLLYSESFSNYHVKDFISIEKELAIFSFLDELFSSKSERARSILQNILTHTNIYACMASLISNLRNTLYIKALSHTMKAPEIERSLKLHPFVIEKSLRMVVSEAKIRDLFHKLVVANIAQKSGKGMYESELGLIFSIELGILGLQKSEKQ